MDWTARAMLCGLCLVGALLVSGAKDVTDEARSRPVHRHRVFVQSQLWCKRLMGSVPGRSRSEWVRLADREPAFLLRACAMEVRQSETAPAP